MKMSIHSTNDQDRFLRRVARILLVVALLLVTAHRLPAPIQEVPENPTPAPQQSAKPKPKRTIKLKDTTDNSEGSRRRQTPSPTPRIQANPNSTPFAGTWSGTMNISLFGDIGYTFLIESAQTTVKMWGTNKPAEIPHTKADVCQASVGVDGISWTWSAWRWTLKPYADGKTALVKVAGPFQNASAVFRREK
jgi:cytoskeletal protein RodZ